MNDADEATDDCAEADVFRASRNAVTSSTYRATCESRIGVDVHDLMGELVRTQWATQEQALSDVVEKWCEEPLSRL